MMWLRFGPWIALAIVSGLLAIAYSRIETLGAELERAGSECNTRIANGLADSQAAARNAVASAVRQKRFKYEQLLIRSNDAAQRAEAERQAASDHAQAMQDEIAAIYRENSDASLWRDTALPAAIAERLQ